MVSQTHLKVRVQLNLLTFSLREPSRPRPLRVFRCAYVQRQRVYSSVIKTSRVAHIMNFLSGYRLLLEIVRYYSFTAIQRFVLFFFIHMWNVYE